MSETENTPPLTEAQLSEIEAPYEYGLVFQLPFPAKTSEGVMLEAGVEYMAIPDPDKLGSWIIQGPDGTILNPSPPDKAPLEGDGETQE